MKSTDLIINVNPKSIFSESIKTIRTNLAFSAIGNEMKVLLATSPAAGDGKSFISANLAVAYAQEGKKVLMIDCDLRRGRQHEIFEVMNLTSGGYSNLILNYKEDVNLGKYIMKTSNANVDLLPTGPTPPNPIELLASENNQKTQERETELTGSFHRYTFFAFYFLCQRQMLFPVCNYYQLCYNLNDNMSKQPVQCQCIRADDSGAQ